MTYLLTANAERERNKKVGYLLIVRDKLAFVVSSEHWTGGTVCDGA